MVQKKDKFRKLGLPVPDYQPRFSKDFPRLEPRDDEELVEVDEDQEEEGEIFDAGNYKSEEEVEGEVEEAHEEVEEKGGFFRWLLGKEKKREGVIEKPAELARVTEFIHKKQKKEVPQVKETEEGTVVMQPREETIVKSEKPEIASGFEIPQEILKSEHTEKMIKKTRKIRLPKEKKMHIERIIEQHKPKTYTKPYVDYKNLKQDLESVNKRLAELQ
ncbi:hypothetical protein J4410_03235 [Candidatus Woesearchaeota archaeon]|nr:hypothetical protein [Candidatus Woesearchaeota archaeon]